MVSAQKLLAGITTQCTEEITDPIVKKSNEITQNIVGAVRINNQLTINVINAAAENFNRTMESVA